MRIPARYVAGNLIFNFDGETWALFRVNAPTYGRMPVKEKLAWHTRVSAALMSVPGESMILGVTQPVEPTKVVGQMVEGVDLAAHPRWAEIARDTLDTLIAAHLTERATYLAVCLPALKGPNRLAEVMGAASARFTSNFGVSALPVSAPVVKAARAVASDIAKPLADILGSHRLTPATEADVEWLYARAALRGIDPPSRGEFDLSRPTVLSSARLAALGEPVLYEGGGEGDDRLSRRYLRVDSERGQSFQGFAVFSHVPAEFTYPYGRGEVLARLDDSAIPVDWCVRIRPTSNAAARMDITGQIRKLAGQYQEYEGDLAGAPETLNAALLDMRAEVARLNASPSLPECQVTFILGFGAPTQAALEELLGRLRTVLEANEYKLPRPLGQQADLWGAMMPGAPNPTVCREYGQYMLPDDIAGCAPMTGTELGDPRGALLGLNIDAGGKTVQFWAGTGPNMPEPDGPKSGSIGVFGRLGSGKSYLTKRIIADTVAMGGRAVTTDRTRMGEYVLLCHALEGDGHTTQVIPIDATAGYCLDPLVVFRGEDACRVGTGFLTLLTSTDPTGPEGAVLDDAVRRVVARRGRMLDVVDELNAGRESQNAFALAAQTVALKVQVVARGALAQVVFGDGEPVSLHADLTVFHAPDLNLPSAEALRERRVLLPEQVFCQALLYLIAAIAGDVAFSERNRFSLIVQDEGYVLNNPQGRELLHLILRDGRKHNAALLFASHSPNDMDPVLQQLLGSRFLFRMDRAAAADGLRFMGMEVTEANIDDIDESARRTGQCLYRDLEGRLGLIQVLEPRTPELRAAFDTGLSRVHTEASARRGRRPRVGA